jgi:hypothetical protein
MSLRKGVGSGVGAGSGSVSQRNLYADRDPYQNVTDPLAVMHAFYKISADH